MLWTMFAWMKGQPFRQATEAGKSLLDAYGSMQAGVFSMFIRREPLEAKIAQGSIRTVEAWLNKFVFDVLVILPVITTGWLAVVNEHLEAVRISYHLSL